MAEPWVDGGMDGGLSEHSMEVVRRRCRLCHVPLGSAECSHVWEHRGEVTMARSEWQKLLATADRYRHAVISLDSEGYENGEYD